jgi:hypothetical protein
MWIGTGDNGCCRDQLESSMWIGKDVTLRFHYKFEVICELEQMIYDNVMS